MRTSWLFMLIFGLSLTSCDGLFGPWKKDNTSCTETDCPPPPTCTAGEPDCMVPEDMGVVEPPCVAAVCSAPPCWEAVCLPTLIGHVPTALWINSTGTIFVTTKGGKIFTITMATGGGMASEASIVANPAPMALNGIFGASDNDIWAVGSSGLSLRSVNAGAWNGKYTMVNMPLNDVSATNPLNVYAVGAGGQLVYFNGTEWSHRGNRPGPLRGVWASPDGEAFSVGENGVMHKYVLPGNSMTITSVTTAQLNDIWGSSRTDIWVAGGQVKNSIILHFDGSVWTRVLEDGEPGLYGVWGDGADVWFVGNAGRILRVSGGQVFPETSTTDTSLTAVFGTSGAEVFAVGANGVLLRRRAR